jgi:hypothetical protein
MFYFSDTSNQTIPVILYLSWENVMGPKMVVASIMAAAMLSIITGESIAGSIDLNNQAQTGRVPPGTSVGYTVRPGTGRALLVCEYTLNDTAQAPTYNGVPLTYVVKSSYFGVGRLGVAAYLMLDPPDGTYPLTLNGTETLRAFILSFVNVAGIDGVSSAQASSQITITDTVTTTHKNAFLAMCETDSGASDDSWAHSTYYGVVYLTDSGLSFGGRTALGRGAVSMSIRAGKGNPPPATYLADVLVGLSPTP